MNISLTKLFLVVSLLLASFVVDAEEKKETLNVLFIGNSYTARHNLSKVVKAMAEEGNPGLAFIPTTVIYGGRTLADHWRLGTQNFVRIHEVTADEVNKKISKLEAGLKADPKGKHAKSGISRQKSLLKSLEKEHPKWDVIVLQSYRDDLEGDPTRYSEYAPKFAKLAKAQGARVILYETTPTTQNSKALTTAPDPSVVQKKARAIAKLAKEIDAAVAPMSLAGLRCQTERPDLTLRFVNDGHLNHTMAYLTACSIYAALFDKSPVGLKISSITDIRFFEKEPGNKQKDRDGNPITRVFSKKDRADLQRIAWESYSEFRAISTE